MKIKELLSSFRLSSDVIAAYLIRTSRQPAVRMENVQYEDEYLLPLGSKTQRITNLNDLSQIEDGEVEMFWVNGKMLMVREKEA